MALDLLARDRPDEVTVVGGGAVVAQNEIFVLAQRIRLHVVVGVVGDVRLVDRFAVDVQRAVEHRNGIARQAHQPLDEVGAAAIGVMADDHVEAVRLAQQIVVFGDDHVFVVGKRVVHRMAVDADGFKNKRANRQRQRDGHRERQNPAENLLSHCFFLFFFLFAFFGLAFLLRVLRGLNGPGRLLLRRLRALVFFHVGFTHPFPYPPCAKRAA